MNLQGEYRYRTFGGGPESTSGPRDAANLEIDRYANMGMDYGENGDQFGKTELTR